MNNSFDKLQSFLEGEGYVVTRLSAEGNEVSASSKTAALRAVKQIERIILKYPDRIKGSALIALYGLIGILKKVAVAKVASINIQTALVACFAFLAKAPSILLMIKEAIQGIFSFKKSKTPEPKPESDHSNDEPYDKESFAVNSSYYTAGDFCAGLPDMDLSEEKLIAAKAKGQSVFNKAIQSFVNTDEAKKAKRASMATSSEEVTVADAKKLLVSISSDINAKKPYLKGSALLMLIGVHEIIKRLSKSRSVVDHEAQGEDSSKLIHVPQNIQFSLRESLRTLKKTRGDEAYQSILSQIESFC